MSVPPSAVAPPNATRNVFRVDEQISGTIVRQIDPEFKELMGIETVLTALFGYGEPVYLSEDYEHEWIRDEVLPHFVEVDAPYTAGSDTTITLVNANYVMDGQLLADVKTGAIFRVAAHNSDTVIQVTKDYAGTTASNLIAGDRLAIMLPDALDNEAFGEAVKGRGEIVHNHPMQIQEKWSQTDLRSSTRSYLTRQTDELDFETQRKHLEVEKQLEAQIIWGQPVAPTNTTRGQFGGFRSLVTSNVLNMNGPFDPAELGDLLESMAQLDDQTRGRTLVAGMGVKRIWDAVFQKYFDRKGEPMTNSVGLTVDKISTNWGDYEILVCRQMPPGELWITNPDDVKIRPVHTQHGYGWMEHEWGIKELKYRGKEKGISNVLTFEVKNQKRHARIIGISENPSDYTDLTSYM